MAATSRPGSAPTGRRAWRRRGGRSASALAADPLARDGHLEPRVDGGRRAESDAAPSITVSPAAAAKSPPWSTRRCLRRAARARRSPRRACGRSARRRRPCRPPSRRARSEQEKGCRRPAIGGRLPMAGSRSCRRQQRGQRPGWASGRGMAGPPEKGPAGPARGRRRGRASVLDDDGDVAAARLAGRHLPPWPVWITAVALQRPDWSTSATLPEPNWATPRMLQGPPWRRHDLVAAAGLADDGQVAPPVLGRDRRVAASRTGSRRGRCGGRPGKAGAVRAAPLLERHAVAAAVGRRWRREPEREAEARRGGFAVMWFSHPWPRSDAAGRAGGREPGAPGGAGKTPRR